MASVENRIVKIEFDNGSFEKNVGTTLTTIGKLNESISKIGSGGFKELEATSKSFNLDGMASAIEGVSAKFIALTTIGVTALANLTNKAIDAGISITKSLSIDQVKGGFDEYELKMGAIQTIMAGTGENLDTVNAKLQELNVYSDQTIYSFADMTSNIQKFTNAGVSLDDSVAAIKGVANVAALSGANADEASRAMYNFGQALGKGSVQAIDWKSIDIANMGTVEFKQQLIDAAEAAGTLTKQGDKWIDTAGNMVDTGGAFQDTLTDEWLTTKVLTDTLKDYSDATTDIGARATASATEVKTFTQLMGTVKESVGSGWATSFEIIFGNFEEAKGLFTSINTVIGRFVGANADARNSLLQGWKDLGGRGELVAGFVHGFQALFGVLGPIKDAFRDIFPKMTSERLFMLTAAFNDFMESLIPSEGTMKNIGRIFKGFFAVLEIGWVILKTAVGVIKDLVGELVGVGSGAALGGLAKVGDFFTDLNQKLVAGGGIVAFFDKMKTAIQGVIPFVLEIKDAIFDFMHALDFSSVKNFFGSIGDALGGISFDTSVFDPIIAMWDKFTDSTGKVGAALQTAGDAIANFFGSIGGSIGGGITGVISGIGDAFTGIIDAITGMFSAGGDLEQSVKESAGGIDWAVVMGGVGVAAVGGLIVTINRLISNGINIDFTGGVLSSISDTFDGLTKTLKSMQTSIKADTLTKIAVAIGILAASMFALSFIDPEKLMKSAIAIAVAFGQLVAAMKLLDKVKFSRETAAKFALMALSFTLISGAMVLLGAAFKIFATMSWEDLAKGGIVFAAVVGAIILTSRLMENEAAGMIKAGAAMILMSFSMSSMYKAVKKFGELDFEVLKQGFISLGVAMLLLVGTMALLPDDLEKKTTGLLGFTVALNIMVFAIKTLGEMDLAVLIQGGLAFALMLSGLVVALNMMPKSMGVQAGQLLALAAAMFIMGVALKIFGSMGWEEMAKGLIGMTGALFILVIAMTAAEEGVVGAGAILIMSIALLALSVAIKAFSAIGLADFATGMVLVVVALAALALTSDALLESVPAMLGVGAGLAAIGLGFALLGVAAAQFAKAILTLSKVEDIGGTIIGTFKAVGAALPALFIGAAEAVGQFIIMLMGFIPQIVEFGIKMILALLEGIVKIAPKLFDIIGVLIVGLLELITTLIPAYVKAGLKIILGILRGIRDSLPQIVVVVGEIIVGFLDALAEALPPIVESVANLFTELLTSVAETLGRTAPTLLFGIGISFLTGFFDGISSIAGQMWDFITGVFNVVIDAIKSLFGIHSPSTVMMDIGVDLIMGLWNGIQNTIQMVWDFFTGIAGAVLGFIGNTARTLFNKGSDFISGLWNGIQSFITTVSNFFNNLGKTVGSWIGNLASTLWGKGYDLIRGMKTGIEAMWESVVTWFSDVPRKIKDFFGDAFSWLGRAGSKIVEGLWGGIKGAQQWLADKMADMLSWLPGWAKRLLGINSPSKVFAEIGQWIPIGLGTGMMSQEKYLETTTEDMGNTVIKTMEDTLAKMPDMLAAMDISASPTITPVLDLSLIAADAKKLEKMLPSNSTMQAGIIAGYSSDKGSVSDSTTPTPEISFTQNINAPKQLSTADIYRQTRNQIAMAKEELSIP